MVKILMHGCNGHMGQVITRLVEAEADMEIIAGVDVSDHISNAYPVYKSLEDAQNAQRTTLCGCKVAHHRSACPVRRENADASRSSSRKGGMDDDRFKV